MMVVRGGVEPPTFRFSGVADGLFGPEVGWCECADAYGQAAAAVVAVSGRRCAASWPVGRVLIRGRSCLPTVSRTSFELQSGSQHFSSSISAALWLEARARARRT